MQILVNTDRNIEGSEKLTEHVQRVVTHAMSHFGAQVMRVEVHLSDENGGKHGADDHRCLMEARVDGRDPTAVTHHADNLHQAIDGAAEKLKHALSHDLERRHDHHPGGRTKA
jgi:ribosomal subunit interface protein